MLYPNIHGLFLDEMASNVTFDVLRYYLAFRSYYETPFFAFTYIVGNPGTAISGAYASDVMIAFDALIVYEGSRIPTPSQLQLLVPAGSASTKYGLLPYGVDHLNMTDIAAAAQSVDFIYATRWTLDENPWGSIAPYIKEEMNFLSQLPN
jgi:hypothetical protein